MRMVLDPANRDESTMTTKTLRTLIIVWLLTAITLSAYAWSNERVEIIVVHSGQSKTLLYNPATHEEVRGETADGNVILTAQPKEQK